MHLNISKPSGKFVNRGNISTKCLISQLLKMVSQPAQFPQLNKSETKHKQKPIGKMAKLHLLRLLISAVVVVAVILSTAEAGQDFSWMPMSKPATCDGSIGECVADGTGEFDLDSESNRRILATTKYISYGALQANSVPCSRRGASYYNCRPGAEANPYTRSCTAATQCRS